MPARDAAQPDTSSAADASPGFDVAPIMECPGPSIDRLQKWLAHTLIVGSGGDASVLVQEGGRYVAKARFAGSDWSELVVQLGNSADASIDLTKSSGFIITYSATADFWIEMRGTVKLHGGDQHSVKLPATGGMTVSRFVSFAPSAWSFVPNLGMPSVPFADVLRTANMFDIVGNTANTLTFTGLRFDAYVPACR
jgi:hypothetical protein